MATDYLFQQSEVIAKNMPEFFGKFNVARNLIKQGSVETIGERDFRANFMTQEGGRFGTYNPEGGDLGRGTAAKGNTMIQTFFSLRLNFELTELAKKATASSKVSKINSLKRALKQALPEMVNYCDMIFHGDGTAVIATATAQTTGAGGTEYTMDEATGVQLVRRGQEVMVYDAALSAARDSGASFGIAQIDYDARKVYLDATVTSAAATDKLVFEGVSGASPSSISGLYYFNNTAKSGTTLGINRALELELVSNAVAAGGVPTHAKGLQLLHKTIKRRGEIPPVVGLVSPEQQANIYDQVMNISNYNMAEAGAKVSADLIPGADMMFKFAGVQHRLDIHQQTDRIDWILPKDWIRAVLPGGDIGFYQNDDGQRFFNLYGASGAPAAATWFGLVLHENFVCSNPGRGGVITGCTQPAY